MNEPKPSMIPGDQLLRHWFRHALLKQCETPGTRDGGLLMGAPIWGEAYIKRFARYCLPSLLCRENLDVLGGGCRLMLFSDQAGLGMLYELTQAFRLVHLGIVPEFIEIPPEVMKLTQGHNKYLVLGTVQNLLPQIAGRHEMGFHFLMPDHIYNPLFFNNLSTLGTKHHAIAQLCTSMLLDKAADKAINAFRHPRRPTLSIPAQELTRLGWKHLHPQTAGAMLVGGLNHPLPQMHLVAFAMKDRLRLHCPHQNPTWLSPATCQMAPMVAPISLDAEIPLLMPGPFYVPKPEDGLACVEVSDEGKPAVPQTWTFEEFADNFWVQSNFLDDAMRFFEAGSEIDIGDEDPPFEVNRWSEGAIDQLMGDMVKRLLAENPPSSAKRFAKNVSRKVRIGL